MPEVQLRRPMPGRVVALFVAVSAALALSLVRSVTPTTRHVELTLNILLLHFSFLGLEDGHVPCFGFYCALS